jgi:hypothetical protein
MLGEKYLFSLLIKLKMPVNKCPNYVKDEVLAAVRIFIVVSWFMIPCSLVNGDKTMWCHNPEDHNPNCITVLQHNGCKGGTSNRSPYCKDTTKIAYYFFFSYFLILSLV